METIGKWFLAFMGKIAHALLRIMLFILGSILKLFGKIIKALGDEIILLGK